MISNGEKRGSLLVSAEDLPHCRNKIDEFLFLQITALHDTDQLYDLYISSDFSYFYSVNQIILLEPR